MILVKDPVTRRLVGWWCAITLLVVAVAVGANVGFAVRDSIQYQVPPTPEVTYELQP